MFPRLFQVGDFSMPTYGVLLSLAVIMGLWISRRNCQLQGIDSRKARKLGTLVVVSGIFGAKLLGIVLSWSFYSGHPQEVFGLVALRSGGVFYGGLLCAFLVGLCYVLANNMPTLATSDASAPGIALGHAIGRIGCFAAGCCWGKPTEAFWGVTFRDPLAHEWAGTLLAAPLVPTQLLDSVVEFTNFFFLMWLFRRKTLPGQVTGAYFVLYGFARYWMEYLRGDPGRGSVLGGALSVTQLISIVMFVIGTLLWLRRSPSIHVPRINASGLARDCTFD